MPDYSMCEGDGCNLRSGCLRFRARPNKDRQCYLSTPGVDSRCEYFITIKGLPNRMLTELEESEPPRRASELEPGKEVTFGGMSKQDFYIEYSTAVGLFGPDSDEVLGLRAKHPNNEDFLIYANAIDALKNQMDMRNQPDPNRFELSVSGQGDGTLATFYIRISNHKVARTEEIIDNMLMVDYDSRDNVVGIEILGIKSGLYLEGFN